MTTTIYIDESGFTGDDLYNADQPHFVIASSLIGDDEAGDILRRAFPRYQGPEFKFSNIWRRTTHRDGLLTFAREIPAITDRLFVYGIDKRFSLIVKMFDYLVEPSFRARGYDYYGRGYARRYMNTIHRDILRFGSQQIYDDSARLWDDFARRPSRQTMAALRAHLDHLASSYPHPISTIFKMLAEGSRRFEASNPRFDAFEDSSEIFLTSVLSTVTYWRQQRDENFDLVHDESSNFLRRQDMWLALLRDDYASPPVEQGNGTLIEFPLRVRSTRAVRSHDSSAVQLCDLVAGLAAKAAPGLDGRASDPFVVDLVMAGAGALTVGGVRPHDDYAEEGVPRASGPDMLDHVVDLLEPYFKGLDKRRS